MDRLTPLAAIRAAEARVSRHRDPLIVILLTFAVALSVINYSQIQAVQHRGLAASGHLRCVMRDIDVFLEPPSASYAKAHHVPIPHPLPEQPYYHPALTDLRKHLPIYNRLQARQPHQVPC